MHHFGFPNPTAHEHQLDPAMIEAAVGRAAAGLILKSIVEDAVQEQVDLFPSVVAVLSGEAVQPEFHDVRADKTLLAKAVSFYVDDPDRPGQKLIATCADGVLLFLGRPDCKPNGCKMGVENLLKSKDFGQRSPVPALAEYVVCGTDGFAILT